MESNHCIIPEPSILHMNPCNCTSDFEVEKWRDLLEKFCDKSKTLMLSLASHTSLFFPADTSLTLTSVQAEHSGVYQCLVSNAYGTDAGVARVQVLTTPMDKAESELSIADTGKSRMQDIAPQDREDTGEYRT